MPPSAHIVPWQWEDRPPANPAAANAIEHLIPVTGCPWLARALAWRGVDRPEIAAGNYRLLPFANLKGIDALAQALVDAIDKGDRLTVVADYDCDGATAGAIAVAGLRAFGAVIDFVVPNRFKHGYGLTPGVVDKVRECFPQTRYILTVDNGVASVEGVAHANALGIGVLITDHHLPGDRLPDAMAIVNPNQPGCPFPSKHLAGCGVMYYVLAATRDLLRQRGLLPAQAPGLASWLDLVALGTVADVVRLDDNNRWLVRQGLALIRGGHARPGIQALFQVAKADPARATTENFGFALGPRLNAAGRLDDMTIGIRCLLAPDIDTAMPYALELDRLNQERKSIEAEMKQEALAALDQVERRGHHTRVVFHPDFHEGVIGIVAGRIKEESNVPTIVFAPAQEEGFIKGSGRSIAGVHLRDALDLVHKRGHGLLEKFGGHAMAAGVTLKADRLDQFEVLFEQAISQIMGGAKPGKMLWIDADLPPEAIHEGTAHALTMGVWGQGFEAPIWSGRFDVLEAVRMGTDKNHLKMVVGREGYAWEAVQFFIEDEPATPQVDLAYRLSWEVFRNQVRIKMHILDRKDVT